MNDGNCLIYHLFLRSWDGWPPHSRSKRLFMRRKYFLVQFEDPKEAPKRSGFLGTSADDFETKIRTAQPYQFSCNKSIRAIGYLVE
jgi:hypothetical protein